MLEYNDNLSINHSVDSAYNIQNLENKWRKMLRNSYIYKDPYSDRELKSFSKELLNPELKNLRTITQEEKHKYVTQFDQILASKTTTIPKNVNK